MCVDQVVVPCTLQGPRSVATVARMDPAGDRSTVGGMDLGIEGRRAAVAGASGGLGLASAKATRRSRRTSRDLWSRRGADQRRCGRGRPRLRADRVRRVDRRGRRRRSSAAATRRSAASTSSCRTRADRRPATSRRPPVELYPTGLDLNLLSIVGMCKVGDPRDAGSAAGVGSSAITSVCRAPADRHADPVQHRASGRHRVPEDRRPRGRARRRHRQHRAARHPRHRPDDRAVRRHARCRRRSASRPAWWAIPTTSVTVVAFLCSEQAKFITGAQLHVDGGAYGGLL